SSPAAHGFSRSTAAPAASPHRAREPLSCARAQLLVETQGRLLSPSRTPHARRLVSAAGQPGAREYLLHVPHERCCDFDLLRSVPALTSTRAPALAEVVLRPT